VPEIAKAQRMCHLKLATVCVTSERDVVPVGADIYCGNIRVYTGRAVA
jgi:hypothetical protein